MLHLALFEVFYFYIKQVLAFVFIERGERSQIGRSWIQRIVFPTSLFRPTYSTF